MIHDSFCEAVKNAVAGCFEVPDGSKNSLADCRAKPFDTWHANKPIVMDLDQVYQQRRKYLMLSMRSVAGTDEHQWHGFLAENGRGWVYEVELQFQTPVWNVPLFQSRDISDLSDEDLWAIAEDLTVLMGDYASTRIAEGTKTQTDLNQFHRALWKSAST